MHVHAPQVSHPHEALVTLDGAAFFVDSLTHQHSDEHVGQMLCGFAFSVGQRVGVLEFCPVCLNDYELSGWNNAGAGI